MHADSLYRIVTLNYVVLSLHAWCFYHLEMLIVCLHDFLIVSFLIYIYIRIAIAVPNVDGPLLTESVSSYCVMDRVGQCIASSLHGKRRIQWVVCDTCQCWYYCVCIGFQVDQKKEFSCCKESSLPNEMWVQSHACIIIHNYYLPCALITVLSSIILLRTDSCLSSSSRVSVLHTLQYVSTEPKIEVLFTMLKRSATVHASCWDNSLDKLNGILLDERDRYWCTCTCLFCCTLDRSFAILLRQSCLSSSGLFNAFSTMSTCELCCLLYLHACTTVQTP